MRTATNINTEIFNKIIDLLLAEGWVMDYKYENFDAGIDFDFFILTKAKEEILLGWDNWMEGEVQCSDQWLAHIENRLSIEFKYGEIENLTPEIIANNRKMRSYRLTSLSRRLYNLGRRIFNR